jgi:hypothetical protein
LKLIEECDFEHEFPVYSNESLSNGNGGKKAEIAIVLNKLIYDMKNSQKIFIYKFRYYWDIYWMPVFLVLVPFLYFLYHYLV